LIADRLHDDIDPDHMAAPFGKVQLGQRGLCGDLAPACFVDIELCRVPDCSLNRLVALPLDHIGQ
jgi:hypothetical protein